MNYEILTPENCQVVLDLYDEIESRHGSSSEIFTVHGYSLRDVLEPALVERNRVKQAWTEHLVSLELEESLPEPTSEYLDVQTLKPITE